MDYQESVNFIHSLSPTLERPTLERMQLFMQETGSLHSSIPVFLIGGTNGKGSTTNILDAMLQARGLKVGRFIGPHILRYNERLSINSMPISDRDFAEIAVLTREQSLKFGQRHPHLGPLTWFEFLCAMAYLYFEKEEVDCACLEVGLGGRFDATNVAADVMGTIITNVDLDHMHILGSTVKEIAFEKAGIMRSNLPVVTAAGGDALVTLQAEAAKKNTSLIKVLPLTPPHSLGIPLTKEKADALLDRLGLPGPHQKLNTLLAITCMFQSNIEERFPSALFSLEDLESRLRSIYWPGRMQFIQPENLLLDAAHNPAGAKALRTALDEIRRNGRFTFITSFFKNKDAARFLDNILKPGDRVLACPIGGRRETYRPEEIVEICLLKGIEASSQESVASALAFAGAARRPDELIVGTGSFMVLKEIMQALGWQAVEDGRPKESRPLNRTNSVTSPIWS